LIQGRTHLGRECKVGSAAAFIADCYSEFINDFKLGTGKTKDFVGVLNALELTNGTALFVANDADKNLTQASRNVANVFVTTGESLNTYDVLRSDKLVFTRGAFEKVEARLNKE